MKKFIFTLLIIISISILYMTKSNAARVLDVDCFKALHPFTSSYRYVCNAINSKNTNNCVKLGTEERNFCFAKVTGSKSFCSNISNEEWRKLCNE